MNLLKCLLTANDCYKCKQTIKPKGVMVHSTGANNPMLRRYVQPNADTVLLVSSILRIMSFVLSSNISFFNFS